MKEKPSYNAADIERYHNGQLTPAERHALEKAALADPFLAEALEGYAYTSAAQTELATLHQRLQMRLEKDQRPRVVTMRRQWLRAAAAVVLLAGGGWLLWQTTNRPTPKQNEVALITPAPTAPAAQTADSILASVKPVQTDSALLKETDGYIASTPKPQARTEATRPSAPPPPAAQQTSTTETAAATITADSTALALQAGSDQKASTLRKAPDTIRNVNVVMQPADVSMAEIVTPSRRATAAKARRKFVVGADSLEPAQGWEAFDDYIATNLRPTGLPAASATREVELAFEINPSGRPVNISATASGCRPCEEEAIRLLREGPRWKRNKKAGKVTIRLAEKQP